MKLAAFLILIATLSEGSLAVAAGGMVRNDCCDTADGKFGIVLLSQERGAETLECMPIASAPMNALCVPVEGVSCFKNGALGKYVASNENTDPKSLDCKVDEAAPTPTKEPSACLPEELVESCDNSHDEAISSCDPKNNSGINGAVDSVTQVSHMLGQAVANDSGDTATGTHAACGKLGAATVALNSAVAAFGTTCTTLKNSCLQKCTITKQEAARCFDKENSPSGTSTTARAQQRKIELDRYTQQIRDCQGLDSRVADANRSIYDTVNTAKQMSNCSNDTDALAAESEYCKLHPEHIVCQKQLAQNCSNPSYRAMNKICDCVGANQNSEACRAAQKLVGSDGITNGGPGLGLSGAGLGGKDKIDLGGDDVKDDGFAIGPVAYGEDPGGSKGGSPAGGGLGAGGQIGGGGGSGRGGGLAQEEKNGSGFMGPTPGAGGGGGFLEGMGSRIKEAMGFGDKDKKDKVGMAELNKFRPNMKPGISIGGLAKTTGPDGITGPNSDIWLKIKNQYNNQLFTFIYTP